MSDKKCKHHCVVPWGDGTWRCRVCSETFIRQRLPFRYFIEKGATIDLKSLCKQVNLPYLPKDLPSIEDKPVDWNDGLATLGTRRSDNLPL